MLRAFLFGALILSLIVNGFLLFNRPQVLKEQEKYGVVDQRLIAQAKGLWVQKEPHGTIEQQGRYAQVIHFPDRTCVSFEMTPGGVGGVPVYCFRFSNRKLLQRLDDVE